MISMVKGEQRAERGPRRMILTRNRSRAERTSIEPVHYGITLIASTKLNRESHPGVCLLSGTVNLQKHIELRFLHTGIVTDKFSKQLLRNTRLFLPTCFTKDHGDHDFNIKDIELLRT